MLTNPEDLVNSLDPNFSSLLEKMKAYGLSFKDSALEKNKLIFTEFCYADTVLFSMFDFNVVKHISFLENFKKIKHYKVHINQKHGGDWTEIVTSTEDSNSVSSCIAAQFGIDESSRVNYDENLASFNNGEKKIIINEIKDSEWHSVNSHMPKKIKAVFKGLHSDLREDEIGKKFKKIRALYNSKDYFGSYYSGPGNYHRSKQIYSLELNNFVAIFKKTMENLCGQSLQLSLCQELFVAYFELNSWHLISQVEKTEVITPYSISYSSGDVEKEFLAKDFSDAMAIFLDLSKGFENIKLKSCLFDNGDFYNIQHDGDEEIDFNFYARPAIGIFKEQFISK